jgi:hypothetical protein
MHFWYIYKRGVLPKLLQWSLYQRLQTFNFFCVKFIKATIIILINVQVSKTKKDVHQKVYKFMSCKQKHHYLKKIINKIILY